MSEAATGVCSRSITKTLLFCLFAFLLVGNVHAQLVVDSRTGEVTQNEVDTLISYANTLVPPSAINGDDMSYGTSGNNLEAFNYMYRVTGDIPSMSTEHMQLMNLAIKWSDDFILLRNDQPLGPHRVLWTGNVEPAWPTKAATGVDAGYAGSENGDMAGRIVFTALNILQTPSIWTQTVPDGDPNGFGATYYDRAKTYVSMMEGTTQKYFTKNFIDPNTYQVIAPTSPAWNVINQNMNAWNRQFLFVNVYQRLAQCHSILGDRPDLVALYSKVVKAATDAFVANVVPVTTPAGQAVYDWGYGNEGDLIGNMTGESGSHASYDMSGIARIFEAGPTFTSATLENMERYAATIEYVIFNGNTTNPAYYKSTTGGGVTQTYLYPQFYFMTPYNTLFWQPAAYGAQIHNNFHNNLYMTAGILYSKHWVYTHPQDMISVASNTQPVAPGGTTTFNITTNSVAPVNLSVSGLPSGATAAFSPATVASGTGSSVLTITAPSNALNGSFLVTLIGNNGATVQNLPLSVVVTAPDFSLSVSSTVTVAAGSPATYTVTVTPKNGFTGDVSLAGGYLLPGMTPTFNPPVIAGGSGTSALTVNTDAQATPGDSWQISIKATSNNIKYEKFFGLKVNNVPQTIDFPAIPDVTYGAGPLMLQATAGSNLPVTYTVTGPATLTGPYTQLGQALTITGAGTVSVTANQPASSYYQAATPVVRTFSVAPALLTVTAQNAMKFLGTPLPSLTTNITGYVNGETSAVLGGAPLVSTTATDSSPAGSYPITVSQGTLTAANYNFQFVNGTLTIPQVPVANAQSVNAAYNTAKPVTLNGTGLGTLAYTVVSQPAHGILSGTAPNLTYTPASNFSGSDSFTFKITDGTSQDSVPATVSISVSAPVLTLEPVSGGSTSATVTAGNSTVFNLQVSGWNGATGPISFACSGAPAGGTCAVSPGSTTLNGTTPIAVAVSVQTTGSKASVAGSILPFTPSNGFPWGVAFTVTAVLATLLAWNKPMMQWRLAAACATLAMVVALSACGGKSQTATPRTPAGTYTVTVSATAGTVTKAIPLTLNVQ